MEVKILSTAEELGIAAARHAADVINQSIKEKDSARLLLSTGASQFEFFKAVVKADIDWSKVEVFHLDEYMNMSEEHPARFKKYLKERFLAFVNVKKMHFVEGVDDIEQNIAMLTEEIRKAPIDLGMIGIGENAHIAFNDPPANFETKEAFMVVELDDKCREQQFKEGWFKTKADVPTVALSMTVHQILQCKVIISCVPYPSKAVAIKKMLKEDVNNFTPATILKTHDNLFLYLDYDSSALIKSLR